MKVYLRPVLRQAMKCRCFHRISLRSTGVGTRWIIALPRLRLRVCAFARLRVCAFAPPPSPRGASRGNRQSIPRAPAEPYPSARDSGPLAAARNDRQRLHATLAAVARRTISGLTVVVGLALGLVAAPPRKGSPPRLRLRTPRSRGR